MDALFRIDKPAGPTSRAVVTAVQRRLGVRKAGHAGTLDPPATGLLLVCVGQATKLVPWLMDAHKEYECGVQLGTETATDDATGDVVRGAPWQHVSREAFVGAIQRFVGEHLQVPPRVSAVRVGGRRAHARVRAGEDVEPSLRPRPVVLYAAEVIDWSPPRARLRLRCGRGYYVRALVRDLGRHLETAAHVTDLRRTRIGAHRVADAVPPHCVEPTDGLPLEDAVDHLPLVRANAAAARRLGHGQRVALGDGVTAEAAVQPGEPMRVVGPEGRLVAIAELDAHGAVYVVRGFH